MRSLTFMSSIFADIDFLRMTELENLWTLTFANCHFLGRKIMIFSPKMTENGVKMSKIEKRKIRDHKLLRKSMTTKVNDPES